MGFVDLQEGLRRELRRRIAAGKLTGMQLARKTGFTQAHISNFLNGKRGLKLRALDRMMKALALDIYDLLDPRETARHAAVPAATAGEDFLAVPVVSAEGAATPVIVREQSRESLQFRRAFLDRLRASPFHDRRSWTRFIVLQIEPAEAVAMWPDSSGRVTALVDRHYVSLTHSRARHRNIYAMRTDSGLLLRYVEAVGDILLLQPRNPAFPALVIPTATNAIVGRVAQVSLKS